MRASCRGPRLGRGGQHTLEFAILIGLVTIAALGVQFLARRGVQTGLQVVSDAVLGPPPPPEPADDPADEALVHVEAASNVVEQGDAAFGRHTIVAERVQGESVNEATRLQVFKE